MKKYSLLVILITAFWYSAISQNVGISADGATPNTSAMLDVDVSGLGATSKKGMLIPRVALSSNTDVTTIPSPATSLMVYNTTAASSGATAVYPGYYYWNGSKWVGFQDRMTIKPYSAFATNTISISSSASWTDIPGLSITITTTGPSTFVISAMGTHQNTGSSGSLCTVEVRLVEGSTYVPNSNFTIDDNNKDGSTYNTLGSWAFQTVKTVSAAGTYTYKVQAKGRGTSYEIGGNNYGTHSNYQGSLIITQYDQ